MITPSELGRFDSAVHQTMFGMANRIVHERGPNDFFVSESTLEEMTGRSGDFYGDRWQYAFGGASNYPHSGVIGALARNSKYAQQLYLRIKCREDFDADKYAIFPGAVKPNELSNFHACHTLSVVTTWLYQANSMKRGLQRGASMVLMGFREGMNSGIQLSEPQVLSMMVSHRLFPRRGESALQRLDVEADRERIVSAIDTIGFTAAAETLQVVPLFE